MANVVDLVEQADVVLTELRSALDAELSTLTGDTLDCLLPAVCALADGVVAAKTVVVGEWESRGRFRLDGSRSASARLARDSGCSPAMAEESKVPGPLVVIHCDEESGRRFMVLEDGTPVAPGALVPWWTQADFERVVHGPPGRIIDVGKRTRFFRGGLRRAIEVRDMHCTFPGCTVPAKYCDVDHIIEYANGGLTTQANGRLRCPTHNRQRPGRRGSGDHPEPTGADP